MTALIVFAHCWHAIALIVTFKTRYHPSAIAVELADMSLQFGGTALMLACSAGRLEVVGALLGNYALDVNMQDNVS